jgi:hypothetical protein
MCEERLSIVHPAGYVLSGGRYLLRVALSPALTKLLHLLIDSRLSALMKWPLAFVGGHIL